MGVKEKSEAGPRLITPNAQVMYACVNEPVVAKDGFKGGHYEIILGFEKTANLKPLSDAVITLARKAWGTAEEKAFVGRAALGTHIQEPKAWSIGWSDFECPIKNGDKKLSADGRPNPTYMGLTYFKAKSFDKPEIVGPDAEEYFKLVRGGYIVRASVYPLTYVMAGKRGISIRLGNIQVIQEGSSPRVAASADFGPAEPFAGMTETSSDDMPF